MNRASIVATVATLALALAGCSSAPTEEDSAPVEQETEPVEAETTEVAPEPEATPESASAIDLDAMPAADTADGVAARIAKAHGVDAFDAAAQVTFTFAVVNAGTEVFAAQLVWDKKGQRSRVSWKDAKAKADVVAMVHLDDPTTGWVTVDGEPATEEQRTSYLEAAHARWINDVYWAFMPQKIIDPGANRELVEDRKVDGKTQKVVKLTFGDVGLTPGDTYWVYADATTYQVNRWDMLLEQMPEGAEPTAVKWTDYRDVGGVVVAHDHVIVDTPRRIKVRDVAVGDSVDAALFAKP